MEVASRRARLEDVLLMVKTILAVPRRDSLLHIRLELLAGLAVVVLVKLLRRGTLCVLVAFVSNSSAAQSNVLVEVPLFLLLRDLRYYLLTRCGR